MYPIYLKRWGLLLAFMVCFLHPGCTAHQEPRPVNVNVNKNYDQPASKYYYFTEAQFALLRQNFDRAQEYMEKALTKDPDSVYLMNELLSIYLQNRENEKAFYLAGEILEKQPNDLHTLNIYGRISHALGRVSEAAEAYEKILVEDPARQNIYLLLADLYLKEENPEKAGEILRQLLALFPESFAGHYYLGKAYMARGQLDKAEEEFKKTLKLNPDLEEPRFALVELYEQWEKTEKVEKLYQEILIRDPENVRAAFELGYYYHQTGKTKDSRFLLGSLGKRSDSEPEIIRTLATLYLEAEQYDKAAVIIDGMLSGSPDSSDLHYLAGVINHELGNDDKAIEHLEKVDPESRFFNNAIMHIAFLYQQKEKVDKAIDYLYNALEKSPEDSDLFHYLGLLYEDIEKYEEAKKALKQGIDIDPGNAKLHFRLGVIYDKMDRKEDCIEQMKKVIALEPDNASALNYLGYTWADMNQNLEQAEVLIKKAIELKPDDGYITDSLGWVFYRQGRYEEAVEVLQRAVELVSDDPIILEHMGDAYLKVSQKNKALKFYKKSLEVKEPKDKPELEKKIQKLMDSLMQEGLYNNEMQVQ